MRPPDFFVRVRHRQLDRRGFTIASTTRRPKANGLRSYAEQGATFFLSRTGTFTLGNIPQRERTSYNLLHLPEDFRGTVCVPIPFLDVATHVDQRVRNYLTTVSSRCGWHGRGTLVQKKKNITERDTCTPCARAQGIHAICRPRWPFSTQITKSENQGERHARRKPGRYLRCGRNPGRYLRCDTFFRSSHEHSPSTSGGATNLACRTTWSVDLRRWAPTQASKSILKNSSAITGRKQRRMCVRTVCAISRFTVDKDDTRKVACRDKFFAEATHVDQSWAPLCFHG